MKALISILILSVVSFTTAKVEPIAPFHGTIVYEINYLKMPEDMQGMDDMLPQRMEMMILGSKTRIFQEMGMGMGTQVVLTDEDTKEADVLMDMMGQKTHVHMSREQVEAEEAKSTEKPKINYLEGTKKIVGYNCKKAQVINADGTGVLVWYTEKIDAPHKDFSELKGFPLEYETEVEGMTMQIVAVSIDEKKPDPSNFAIPDGYRKMSFEELSKMSGGVPE